MNIDKVVFIIIVTITVIYIVLFYFVARPYPKLTLEQVQDACIRSAVINDDFEKVETCLKITGEKK